jgi:hypothetical protein
MTGDEPKPWIDPVRISAANFLSEETVNERRRQASALVARA